MLAAFAAFEDGKATSNGTRFTMVAITNDGRTWTGGAVECDDETLVLDRVMMLYPGGEDATKVHIRNRVYLNVELITAAWLV